MRGESHLFLWKKPTKSITWYISYKIRITRFFPTTEASKSKLSLLIKLLHHLLNFIHATTRSESFTISHCHLLNPKRLFMDSHKNIFITTQFYLHLIIISLPLTKLFLSIFPCFPDELPGKLQHEKDENLQQQALAAAWYDHTISAERVPFFHGCEREGGGGGGGMPV